ncbi:calpain-9-like isoform X1 [Oncorhynchus tshawytscha]|uniref:Calpain 12 n=1 Tax=Oncorhynchus tshawytscha TaxID=74940 RepID=A0AAZ3QAI6_ONCTS|nr:calpain-9-like isoform X1 [Oncorhynchus tshawytscha]XP_042151783.1 calpain-9-like isoform X1 [Oncorhynchus tshawytscha]XP_042151784.1 calpain-9-like isoform X1 [Oncorhynchus tshawytscha]XP_042151785.1 calpain-9-like isoform X1 [Oncorhynchus tshawytscha]
METRRFANGSIANPVQFRDQHYVALLDACVKSGSLFSDPTFTPDQSSIGMPTDPDPKKEVKWLRPKEISANAVFVEDTTCTTDICQGQLGDCWLLAALSCLTMHPNLFVKVVPPNQSLTESYAGIFHFMFWQYGEWVEVVVDDRLPVREGRLLFSYSCTRNEYWSALVEKAYAKLIGSYGSLKGGNISEAMEDFTGGIAYSLPVSSRAPRVMWKALSAALSRGSLLSCFIQASNYREIGTVTAEGLVKGHAYAITDTDTVKKLAGEALLLRLRNPWGFVEYSGPWSDTSKDWDDVDAAEKKRIDLKNSEDGEFWISVEDFNKLFDTVELCSVDPDPIVEEDTSTDPDSPADPPSAWTLSSHKGSWVSGSTAGGSCSYPRSFWKNPQFQLVLAEHDDDIEMTPGEKKVAEKQKEKAKQCTVLVELLQKDRRKKEKVNFLHIAFHIYRVPPKRRGLCLDQSFFSFKQPVGSSGVYQPFRAVWREVRLDPGNYVILASTYSPNQPAEFFLRVYSKTGNNLGTQDFTCSTGFLMVMSMPPVLPEDRKRVQKTFDEVAGPDDKLNAKEFMKLVNSVLEKDYQLPLETCRQLIFGEETGGRSSLTREQTEPVLTSLRSLQSIFFKFDQDSSGTMSPFELSLALQAAGVQCDGQVIQLLWERFGSGELHLPFHGFVACVTRLRKLFALYKSESNPEVKDGGINTWLLRLLTV